MRTPVLSELIHRQTVRSRAIATIVGGILAAIGIALVVTIVKFTIAEHRLWEPRPEELLPMIGGGLLAVLGLVWIGVAWLRPHRGRVLLSDGIEPVWIYLSETTTITINVGGSRTVGLFVGLVTGEKVTIFIGSGFSDGPMALGRRVLAELRMRFPYATVGYSPDAEQQFLSQPAALRRRSPQSFLPAMG